MVGNPRSASLCRANISLVAKRENGGVAVEEEEEEGLETAADTAGLV